jgi:hypothetical protein
MGGIHSNFESSNRSCFEALNASTFEMSLHPAIHLCLLASGWRLPDANAGGQVTIRPFRLAS